MLVPACNSPISRVRRVTSRSGGGTSPAAMRCAALNHGGLPHARLTGEDGVVLPPAHKNIHDLPDLLVTPDDGVDLSRCGPVP